MSPLNEEFKVRLNCILPTWQPVIEDVLQREQETGEARPDVDCHASTLFIVSAWEGCIGIAKSQQSLKSFGLCMKQLHDYVQGLLVSPAK